MNLQVPVPYQKCAYSCPMCVARNHKNVNSFTNLYQTDRHVWQRSLENAIINGNYDSIVLTGECDPTQNMRYCDDVISVVDNLDTRTRKPTIEFTTHCQNINNVLSTIKNGHKIDVITVSITNSREYLNAWRIPQKNAFFSPIYRMVILLTDEFDFLNVINFNSMGFDQITFKTLQYGEDPKVNAWIDANNMDETSLMNIRAIVDKYNCDSNCSVRLDTSCQDATNRYEIFRSDGNVYDSWEAMYPKGAEKESVVAYDKQGSPIKEITFSKKEREYANIKLDDISYPPERFVYKDVPPPIVKKAREIDYE